MTQRMRDVDAALTAYGFEIEAYGRDAAYVRMNGTAEERVTTGGLERLPEAWEDDVDLTVSVAGERLRFYSFPDAVTFVELLDETGGDLTAEALAPFDMTEDLR